MNARNSYRSSLKYRLLLGICCFFPLLSLAAEGGGFWHKENEHNRAVIDHSDWDRLLAAYVVESPDSAIRKFRYRDMDKSATRALDGYLKQLQKIDPREYSKQEQLAYWMNLYNALSVQQILPYVAGKDGAQPLPATLWTAKQVKVAKQKLSLRDIEQDILRPIWKDHRIHFGLNCASMDCPNMDGRAYTGATIREQLRNSGTRFVNDDSGVRYADGKLTVSRLFDIYQQDFAPDTKTLLKVFAHYAVDKKALYLLGYQGELFYSQDLRLNSP
ncbi:MAG: DUF547 domain-containing protein [Porticoccaceae bacterium]